jgi:hypothetical protein
MERYVEKNEKWKTRGFYLEMVIDHTRLPDVLVALTNSEWPVRIVRVQQADIKEEELVDATSGAMAGGEMGMGAGYTPPGMGAADAGAMSGMGLGSSLPGLIRRPSGVPGMGNSAMGVPGMEGVATNEPDPLDDPMLVFVAVSGLITLYNPPVAAGAPAEGVPTDQMQGLDQTIPSAATEGQPTAPSAAEIPAAEAPAAESGTPAATPPATTPAADSAKPPEVKPDAAPPATPAPATPPPATPPADAKAEPAAAAKPAGS